MNPTVDNARFRRALDVCACVIAVCVCFPPASNGQQRRSAPT